VDVGNDKRLSFPAGGKNMIFYRPLAIAIVRDCLRCLLAGI